MLRFALLTTMLLYGPLSFADEPSFDITIKDHRFTPSEITIPKDTKVWLVIINQDATAEEFESHDLHREKIIPGNSRAVIRVGPLQPGNYQFVGEFHEDTAHGNLIVK